MTAIEGAFADRYGPWAVVTGAAAGVGLAYTDELVRRGLGVVMVDIAADLDDVAGRVAGTVRTVAGDVLDQDWLDRLDEVTADIEVGLAVANAGASYVGPFLGMDPAVRRHIVDVNCTATADLAAWALPAMVDRRRGGFVATSSGSALAGTAGVALYSGTKAFSVNLVEALGWELRDSGVDTLAVVAPSMDTPGFRGSEADSTRMSAPAVAPAVVVAGALDALPAGGRHLADPGLEYVATVDRREQVEIMSAATTGMYPARFDS